MHKYNKDIIQITNNICLLAGSADYGYSIYDFRTNKLERQTEHEFCVFSTTENNGKIRSTSASDLLEYDYVRDLIVTHEDLNENIFLAINNFNEHFVAVGAEKEIHFIKDKEDNSIIKIEGNEEANIYTAE